MKISIIGSGYVGLVTGACFADLGHKVTFVDISKERVSEILAGRCPIFEPKLPELLKKHSGKAMLATTDYSMAIPGSEIIFICVGTPQAKDGGTDMKYVESAAREIGRALAGSTHSPAIVLKSTTPPTKMDGIISLIEKESGKKEGTGFYFCTNPEFLREGSAVDDFLKPERIVMGCAQGEGRKVLSGLYNDFPRAKFFCSPKTALMIKYASNAFLAVKISFANEIGNMCKAMGIDSFEVADGMGLDKRIGRQFLNSGCGFGGSCLPKDTHSLAFEARKLGQEPRMLDAALLVNESQPKKILSLLKKRFASLKGKKMCILGLAFKPNTDDVRESPAIEIAQILISEGCQVFAFDPKASENARKILPQITCCKSAQEAVEKSDAVILMADWKEFAGLDTEKYVLEGKRILNIKKKNYEGICW